MMLHRVLCRGSRAALAALVLLSPGCTDGPSKASDSGSTSTTPPDPSSDRDGDGTVDTEDCAPDNPAYHPGAAELCNGIDDDCDGLVDNDPVDAPTFYADTDGDGFHGTTDTVAACEAPAGYASTATDCDDTAATTHPGADEGCDLVDSDCDGALGIYEVDNDGDGYASCAECNDLDPLVYPGATEVCNGADDNCDGEVDNDIAWFPDTDNDGYGDTAATPTVATCDARPAGHVGNGLDCDDTRRSVHPDAQEICDAADTDEDCDGLVDDADDSATGQRPYAPDADGDGYGDASAATALWCDPPSGLEGDASDCDDTDPAVRPGLAFLEPFLCTEDSDGDGFGSRAARPPLEPGSDCDDLDPAVYPGAAEADPGLLEDPACDGGGGLLADAHMALLGEDGLDLAGSSISSAGDIDGDGLDDLIIGAPDHDDGTDEDVGVAYIVLGASLAGADPATWSLADADFVLHGDQDGRHGGRSVAAAGDLDGDGLGDVLVGGDGRLGRVFVFLGSTLSASLGADLDLADADYTIDGASSYSWLGLSLSGAGDVDGDGLDDLLAGGLRYAVLFFGSTLQASGTALDYSDADFLFDFPATVSSTGDIDGDGLDDILVGATGGYEVGLYLGSTLSTSAATTLTTSDADYTFAGTYPSSFDATVSHAGDVDGDGLDDVLLGSTYGSMTAHLFYASRLLASSSRYLHVSNADLRFEALSTTGSGQLAGVGDLDGDGLDDLLMSQGGYEPYYPGYAYVLLGSNLNSTPHRVLYEADADFVLEGDTASGNLGTAAAGAGDVNGDGIPDLLVGGSYVEDDKGRVHLIYGGTP